MKKTVIFIMMIFLSFSTFAREYANPNALISIEEVNKIREQQGVVVVDYRVTTPPKKTIPNARVITDSDLSKTIDGVEAMIIPKGEFEELMSKLGITNTDTIIIVGEARYNAARLWWALRLYGHKGQIRVLNESFTMWQNKDYPMETPKKPIAKKYIAQEPDYSMTAVLDDVIMARDSKDGKVKLLDVRSSAERIGGRIPNSVNVDWVKNLTTSRAKGKFRSADKLAKLYEKVGVTPNLDEVVVYCTIGWRSSYATFILVELLGYKNVKNYDGGWQEYKQTKEPISRGF